MVSFSTLVDVYFGSQNVSQVNGQGPDRGSQYRSIIFYQNEEQKAIILKKIAKITKTENTTVAAEVYPFQKFWKAEAYHQNYERLHPNNPYVRNVSIPRLKRFKAKFPHLLKRKPLIFTTLTQFYNRLKLPTFEYTQNKLSCWYLNHI